MSQEIQAVGGYGEVGRNSTAVKIEDEIFILDMGLHMENYVQHTDEIENVDLQSLTKSKSIPDLRDVRRQEGEIKGIILTHSHLDHCGAVPYLAQEIDAPIIGTPFTIKVLERIAESNQVELDNELIKINPNDHYQITKNVEVELIHATHSTLQTAMVLLKTSSDDEVLYANEYKFDNDPILGSTPNYERLKQIKPKTLITDSLYVDDKMKRESENIARKMLEEIILEEEDKSNSIIVTTFSSRIDRHKSIVDLAKKIDRKIVFIGSSFNKYIEPAKELDLIDFHKDVEKILYGYQASDFLEKIKDKKDEYLLVVTGSQGEPKATLSKIANDQYGFQLDKNDTVIFSANTIPTETIIQNKKELEEKLQKKGVKLFNKVHVSGHAAKEDIRKMIRTTNPENIIPVHGKQEKIEGVEELALEENYSREKIHKIKNGDKVEIN